MGYLGKGRLRLHGVPQIGVGYVYMGYLRVGYVYMGYIRLG